MRCGQVCREGSGEGVALLMKANRHGWYCFSSSSPPPCVLPEAEARTTSERWRIRHACSDSNGYHPPLYMTNTPYDGPVTCVKHSRYTEGSPAHLGVLKDVHDEDGKAQAEDIGRKAGVEVGVGVLLQASGKDGRRREC